jgi:hypothetical protein
MNPHSQDAPVIVTAISTATMELMRSWGLESRLRAGGKDVELQPWVAESLAAAAVGRAVEALVAPEGDLRERRAA